MRRFHVTAIGDPDCVSTRLDGVESILDFHDAFDDKFHVRANQATDMHEVVEGEGFLVEGGCSRLVLQEAVAVAKCHLCFIERLGLLPGVFDESSGLEVRRDDEVLLPLHLGDTITHVLGVEDDSNEA